MTEDDEHSIGFNLPALRRGQPRNHAHRCVPVLLRVRTLQSDVAPEAGRLLRVLFLRFG